MYRLTDALKQELLRQPESGMGFQVVEITTDTNHHLRGIVYNAELVLPDGYDQRTLLREYRAERMKVGGYGQEIREIRLMARNAASGWATYSAHESRGAYGAQPFTGPAKDAPKRKTTPAEMFRRFSAFANDRRVTPDLRLLPGTYATTHADSLLVHTGKEAVARYALPNPDPAVHRFSIITLAATTIQCGIVEPANGQPGGGVEVLFAEGTQMGSVWHKDEIPPG